MIFTAPKIIAGIISTVWAFTTFLGVARSLPEADSNIIPAAYYEAVLPVTTTVAPTTTVTTIATCDDALQLALDLGFPADQLGTLDLVMHREYTLSLHDALPMIGRASCRERVYIRS